MSTKLDYKMIHNDNTNDIITQADAFGKVICITQISLGASYLTPNTSCITLTIDQIEEIRKNYYASK